MKLALEIKVPGKYIRSRFSEIIREFERQINGLTEGRVAAVHNAYTAAPTSGKHQQGDFLRNSEPTELGAASSMYVITGWICTASGEPGTWKECRSLTGN